MRSTILIALLAGAGIAIAQPTLADPAYKADEIVSFFAKSAELGAARGICIGTVEECSQQSAPPTGFDMLINFELDSAELTKQARDNLEEFAKALKDDRLSSARFLVEGHTDAIGSEGYNTKLSERRAQSVTAFLLERGVAPEKVDAVGLGETHPRVANPRDAQNRRVEMRIQVQ
jgi:outer membrane protein OmpA-like peptidoglycan-associated protein